MGLVTFLHFTKQLLSDEAIDIFPVDSLLHILHCIWMGLLFFKFSLIFILNRALTDNCACSTDKVTSSSSLLFNYTFYVIQYIHEFFNLS